MLLPSPHKSTHRSLWTKKLLRRRAYFVSQREVLAEQEDTWLTWKGQHREMGGRFLSRVLRSCSQSQTQGPLKLHSWRENLCSGCDREDPCSLKVHLPFSQSYKNVRLHSGTTNVVDHFCSLPMPNLSPFRSSPSRRKTAGQDFPIKCSLVEIRVTQTESTWDAGTSHPAEHWVFTPLPQSQSSQVSKD